MLNTYMMDTLRQIAHGIAVHFGSDCEVVIHDLTGSVNESSIVMIENGHVSNRKTGDGPSHVVLDAIKHGPEKMEDKLASLTRTGDGKILKSSTMFIRDESDKVCAILGINYDISKLLAAESAIGQITATTEAREASSAYGLERIPLNVGDLLDELITQSIRLIGKPVPMMTKEEKIRAIQFLNDSGAFLITKSGDKVSSTFGISKYTLYSYMDAGKNNL
jgi:predicted transcriptional regulator YheO